MAAYDVDIQLKIAGQQELKNLQTKLSAAEKAAGGLSENLRTLSKFDVSGATRLLNIEQKLLNITRERLKLQRQFNESTSEGNKKARQAAADFIRRQRIQRQGLAQYAGPIGPGAASPLPESTPVALSTQLRGRINRQLKEAADLQAHLGQMEKRSLETNKRLLNNQKLQRKELGKVVDEKVKAIQTDKKAADLAVQDARKDRRKRVGAAISAGAFPLLFGGGPGMAIGGAIGGAAAGATFGPASIALQVLGGKLDAFAQNMRSLSDNFASTSDVLGVLEDAGIQVDSSLKNVVDTLKEQGRFAEAYNLELRELEKRFGPGAQNMLSDYNLANERLGDEFSRLTAELQSYAIPALTLFTNIIARIASIIPDIPEIVGFGVGTVLGPGAGFATKQAMRAGEQAGSVQTNMFGFAGATEADMERSAEVREFQLKAERDNEKLIKDINRQQLKIAREKSKERDKNLKFLREELSIERTRLDINRRILEQSLQNSKFIRDQELSQAQAVQKGERSLRTMRKEQTMGFLGLVEQGKSTADEDQLFGLFEELRKIEFAEIEQRARALGDALGQAGFSVNFIKEEMKAYIDVLQTLAKAEFTDRLDNFKTVDEVFAKQLEKLDLQIEAEKALTEEARQQAELQLLLLNIREQNTKLKPSQLQILEQKSTELFNLQNKEQSPIASFIEDSLDALTDLEARAVEVAQGIGDAIGNSLVSGAQNLITGAATVKEVFADMLNSVANVLAKQATQMIATYIAIGIARAFAGMGGGGGDAKVPPTTVPGGATQGGSLGGFNFGGVDQGINFTTAAQGAYYPGGFKAFNQGGVVSQPTLGLVGEGGEPEYIIPQSKMRESMARYSRGSRGGGVIPSDGGSSASGDGGVAVAAPIDVRYTVERINSVDYVTADQFQSGMQRAAQQGAQRGEQNTLKRLQLSSGTRRRVGI